LWNWRQDVINGQVSRTTGSIILLDDARNTALTWNFREGWPCKLEGPALNGKTSEVAIETLEICHEGLELAS
jgi:phage tail-like protein